MTRCRTGKTLIEMLILISVLSVIMGTVTMILLGLFKTDRMLRRDLAQQTALARLGSKFRTDAHAATTCQVGQTCDLSFADGRLIRYSFADQRIHREVRRADTVEHRDAFVLPDTAMVHFDQPEVGGGRLVRLAITAREQADKRYLTPVRPAVIEAAVGLSTPAKEPIQ